MLSAETQPVETEKPSAKRGRHRWLPYLTLVLLIEGFVCLRLLLRDPLISARVTEWRYHQRQKQQKQHLRALMKHDPPVGAPAPRIHQAPVRSTAASSSESPGLIHLDRQPTVLVFVGPCTGCIAGDLAQWQQVQKRWQGLRILIVSRDKEKSVRQFLKSNTLFTLPIIPDPQGRIAKTYNAAWSPRAYGVDEKGRLIWLEQPGQLAPESIAQMVWAQVRGDAR